MAPILFQVEANVAHITLNRPEKYNSFNREMALMLQGFLHECADNPYIRCVVISGSGKAFSAGQDLAEVTDPEGPGMAKILKEHYNPIVSTIRKLNKPIIAAVNGVAAGAGANIALCCDVVVASESASFIQAFSKIGLIPDSGGTYFLPRLIGFQKASALMMLGEKISAAEAEKLGMIYQVYPDDIFATEVKKMAKKLAEMPTKGLAFTKEILNLSTHQSFEEQLLSEDKYQQQAAGTKDFKEGVSAFIEKRPPVFTGE